MRSSQHEQRARFGRMLDSVIIDIVLQILEILVSLTLGW